MSDKYLMRFKWKPSLTVVLPGTTSHRTVSQGLHLEVIKLEVMGGLDIRTLLLVQEEYKIIFFLASILL